MIYRHESAMLACERIVQVLKAELPALLAALADVGLYLPAPEDAAYYLCDMSDADLPELLVQHPVSVYVTQDRGAELDYAEDATSGDGVGKTEYWHVPIRVRLVATDCDAFEPLTRPVIGRVQTLAEWMEHRARRYQGAILECLYRHAPATDGRCLQVQLLEDDPGTARIEDRHVAIAASVWMIDQQTYVPMAQRSIPVL
jgi:hypothetical protein